MTLEFAFAYKPSFSTPYASFAHFGFGEQEERLRVRVCVRVERIVIEFLRLFNSSKCVKCGDFVKVRKLNLLTPFQDTKAFFHPTSKFFIH